MKSLGVSFAIGPGDSYQFGQAGREEDRRAANTLGAKRTWGGEMRKITVTLLIVGLLAGAFAESVDAKKKKKDTRKATVVYSAPSYGSGDATGVCTDQCVRFGVTGNERFLSLKITDDSGLPPAATIGQDSDPSDNFIDRIGEICGATEEPIPITPGVEVVVWVWAAPRFVTGGPCLGIGTAGEVEATFTTVP
jgi:hypothetical protein